MIEMRYYIKEVETNHTRTVLQYRQKIDITVRAGMWDSKGIAETANYQWSAWQDVPTVVERDPACP